MLYGHPDRIEEGDLPPGIDGAARPGVPGQIGHGTHLGDAAAPDQDEAEGDDAGVHGVDHAVDNEHDDPS